MSYFYYYFKIFTVSPIISESHNNTQQALFIIIYSLIEVYVSLVYIETHIRSSSIATQLIVVIIYPC